MALGADACGPVAPGAVEGLALTAVGVALGAVAALQLTRLLGYLLYQVSPRDPLAFGSAVLVVAAASIAAVSSRDGGRRGPIRFGRCADERIVPHVVRFCVTASVRTSAPAVALGLLKVCQPDPSFS